VPTGFSLCCAPGENARESETSDSLGALSSNRSIPGNQASSSFGAASCRTWKWPGRPTSFTFRCHSKFQLPPQARDLVMTVIQEQRHKTIDLDAAVVMPDHVHAIFRVIEPNTLSQVLQQIKGRSSRKVNQILRRQGRVWLVESFDHIIRHVEELEEKTEYMPAESARTGAGR
jgi:REP element-mobilizing transposase RayT